MDFDFVKKMFRPRVYVIEDQNHEVGVSSPTREVTATTLYSRLASLAGFEPATRCLEGSRSVQLSYRDATILTIAIRREAEQGIFGA